MDQIRVRSKINRVAVFPDRALVTRRCFVELDSGACEIIFELMPSTIIPGSLRAKGTIMGGEKDGSSLRVLSIDHRPSESSQKHKDQPTVQSRKLIESRDRLRNQLENLRLRRSFLLGVTARSRDHISRTLVQKELTIEDCERISDFLFESLARTADEIRKTEGKEKELEAKLARTEDEKVAGEVSGGSATHEVHVGLHVPASLKGILELSYMIPDARWAPFYEIHANPGQETIMLHAYGIVSQEAGESWPDVKMRIATTPPPIGARRPELEPLFLTSPTNGKKEGDSKDAQPPTPGTSETLSAFVPDGVGWDFEVKRPGTVPADGSPVRALLGQWELKASYEYVCIPKLSEFAFLRARIRNTRRTDLLPGQVNVFYGSDFIGTAEIPYVSPGSEFEAYLGADSTVRIRQHVEQEGKGRGGVISKVHRKGLRVKMTIQNNKSGEKPVVLMERMPVSRHKEIRIKDSKFSEEPKKKTRNGILTWVFALKPKEKREITYSYTVEYPRGMRLQI
ncbi:MAG: mucoidy inhibitor MuiA family protein [Planctomycetota bacterium]|nr:mucoidy inhibitor MuiA family protein [Planctomycetota bacterium]